MAARGALEMHCGQDCLESTHQAHSESAAIAQHDPNTLAHKLGMDSRRPSAEQTSSQHT